MKQSTSKSLAKVIDKEDSYKFRTYAFTLPRIHKVQLFEDDSVEIILGFARKSQ